ncbi:MAG: hypothetical protein LBH06_05220 [Rikenellaceae bacterium]|jgi:hypothetical protein|nr:hypothetical protein [Rikenellaceae bacterium]
MKKLFFVACAALALNIFGCGKPVAETEGPVTRLVETTRTPGDTVAGTDSDYTLPWPVNDYPAGPAVGQVQIVRTKEQFAVANRYANDSVPDLDFNTCSVVNACGGSTSGVDKLNVCLTWLGEGRYRLTVKVYQNYLTIAPIWKVSLPVKPAIGPNEAVELDVQYISARQNTLH